MFAEGIISVKTSMIEFPSITPLANNWYRLNEDFSYAWNQKGELYKIIVPAGFECNLATIWPGFWWIVSPFDLGPSVIHHDYLYEVGGKLTDKTFFKYNAETEKWEGINRKLSRKESDKLLVKIMKEYGISKAACRVVYFAVRLLGWSQFED